MTISLIATGAIIGGVLLVVGVGIAAFFLYKVQLTFVYNLTQFRDGRMALIGIFQTLY